MGKTLSIGTHLRAARKKKGWDIPSVSKELCISKGYLRALEEDDKAALPRATFAVGFLRSYATHLGLDANGLVKTAQSLYQQPVVSNEVSDPEASQESRVPARPLFFTIAGSLIGLYGTWVMFSGGGELRAELTPPVPDHLSKLIADEYANPSGLLKKDKISEPEISTTSPDIERQDNKITPSDLPETMNINARDEIETVANQSISETVLAADFEKGQLKTSFEIKADKDTWVLIKTAENKILLEGVLKSGKSFSYSKDDELFLTTGDAGAIKIIVDGISSDPIGNRGVVLKDVDLSKYSKKPNELASSH